MNIRNRTLTDWKWQAGLVVVLSFALGIIAEYYTKYHIIQVIVGVNAVAGIVGLVYQLSNSGKGDNSNETQKESKYSIAGTESQSNSEQRESRIGPSKGLTAEEQAIQNEMILRDYREFHENPVATFIHRQPTVNGISDDWEEDADTIRKVWRISTDDDFYNKKKSAWEMSLKAVHRAKELGEDILLDEDIQDEILEVLLENYRGNPVRPKVSRDTLTKALDCSENEMDHNIWLLKKKRYVETEAYLGDTKGYREVKISDLGRRVAK